ncbi:ABC transporter ATP-binding protein [Haliangium sp.]|uniref:ABC transporter ATP-binding protein n=1 Tax=Haliangium sp. TaxID=2663208 RepID=UPI003D13ACA0
MSRPDPTPSAHGQSPWSYLRPYKGRVAVGVAMLIVTNALALAEPVLLGDIVDALAGDDPGGVVPNLALLLVAFALGTGVTRVLSRVFLFNTARGAEYDLRSELFGHLLTLDPGFYRKHATGDLMSRLTNDVQTVRAMWGPGVLNIVNTAVVFVPVLIMMLRIDPMLTLWAVLPYPSMVILGRLFGRRLYKSSRAVQVELGSLSTSIQEDLTGIGIIKSYNLEEPRRDSFRVRSERLLDKNMVLTKVRGQLVPALTSLASASAVIVLWVGGQAVIDGSISLGDLVEFLSYLARLVWPTLALGWMLSLFQRGLASWQRLQDLLGERPAIADGPGPDPDPDTIRGDLELRGLSVEIEGHKVLDDVHLRMPAGTVTAIVGRTGSGKSMLVECLPRLNDVPAGTVFLDGHDITELSLPTLRHAIGYAPQEAFLFSTTIARNIAFGYERYLDEPVAPVATMSSDVRPSSDIDERLVQASTGAGLARDLSALPSGYDTVVGERGITLSGGQRQRVALARALAAAPRVLVLDDSLSSVDAETEREILEHLTELMRGRTAILISHRVAAVKRADQIVCLDQGKVVEVGTHDELLSRGGVYAEVYQSQLEYGDVDDPAEGEPADADADADEAERAGDDGSQGGADA